MTPKSVTLNDHERRMAVTLRYFFTEFGSFEASYVKVIEVRSTLCDKNLGQKSNLQQYMTYGDVFREY